MRLADAEWGVVLLDAWRRICDASTCEDAFEERAPIRIDLLEDRFHFIVRPRFHAFLPRHRAVRTLPIIALLDSR